MLYVIVYNVMWNISSLRGNLFHDVGHPVVVFYFHVKSFKHFVVCLTTGP